MKCLGPVGKISLQTGVTNGKLSPSKLTFSPTKNGAAGVKEDMKWVFKEHWGHFISKVNCSLSKRAFLKLCSLIFAKNAEPA